MGVNWVEWAAALLGMANITLLVRRNVWNYPFGMAMVGLYAFVFYNAKLYGEAWLQGFFFLMQGWGWILWLRAGGSEGQVKVEWLDNFSRLIWVTATAALALNVGWFMHRFTDASLPYADAAIAGASIVAQILLAFRRIENWILWILIDLGSVAVYITKGLWPTAALYTVFLIMSVMGLKEWMAALKQQKSGNPIGEGKLA